MTPSSRRILRHGDLTTCRRCKQGLTYYEPMPNFGQIGQLKPGEWRHTNGIRPREGVHEPDAKWLPDHTPPLSLVHEVFSPDGDVAVRHQLIGVEPTSETYVHQRGAVQALLTKLLEVKFYDPDNMPDYRQKSFSSYLTWFYYTDEDGIVHQYSFQRRPRHWSLDNARAVELIIRWRFMELETTEDTPQNELIRYLLKETA